MKAILFPIVILLSSCSSYSSFTVLNQVPEPIIYSDEKLSSKFYSADTGDASGGVLYVTDRSPAKENDREKYYKNERSSAMRAGSAIITSAENKKEKSTVDDIVEFGYLSDILPYGELSSVEDEEFFDITKANTSLTNAVNEQLKASTSKDIYIYVHGYKVVFENPLLVTHELWRFIGYDGAFIAYAWPSTPNKLAYFKDIETSQLSGQNLRLLIEYLANSTEAAKIHIIGYSAGTRVVMTALQQLALKNSHLTKDELKTRLKLGNVILTASDYDLSVFAAAVGNGLLNVPSNMTIYMSGSDKALGISSWVFNQQRLGQFVIDGQASLNPRIKQFFLENESLRFIDATNAEGSSFGNGHGYFINSPWVSSDILMILKRNAVPSERGLIRKTDNIQWEFPSDYKQSLIRSLDNKLID